MFQPGDVIRQHRQHILLFTPHNIGTLVNRRFNVFYSPAPARYRKYGPFATYTFGSQAPNLIGYQKPIYQNYSIQLKNNLISSLLFIGRSIIKITTKIRRWFCHKLSKYLVHRFFLEFLVCILFHIDILIIISNK